LLFRLFHLKQNHLKQNKISFHFLIVGCVLGGCWMLRLYVAGSNIFYMLNYRNQLIENHRARGTISIVYVFVISHLIIGGLSAFWFYKLMQNGIYNFLVFQPPKVKDESIKICKLSVKDDRF
jgi:hypothetical protein